MDKTRLPDWVRARCAPDEVDQMAARFIAREMPDGSIRHQIERDFTCEVVKNGDVYTVAVSDDTLDRYGDVLDAAGVDFVNYQKNPVWLIDHDYRVQSIVGQGINGRIVKNRVLVDYAPDPIGSSPATDMVRAKLSSGSLRATSVGFIPIKWEKILDKKDEWTGGFHYSSWGLLENSWVAVPANPNALRLDVGDTIVTNSITPEPARAAVPGPNVEAVEMHPSLVDAIARATNRNGRIFAFAEIERTLRSCLERIHGR